MEKTIFWAGRLTRTNSARCALRTMGLVGGALGALALASGCAVPALEGDASITTTDDASSTTELLSGRWSRDARADANHADHVTRPATDAATPAVDAATPAVDASTPPPAVDASTPPRTVDASTPPAVDASTPPAVDASAPPPPPPSSPPPDAGVARPQIGGCTVFPADNPWNRDISADPVDPHSANYIANIQANASGTSERFLHPDFGSDPSWGIPYVVVPAGQAMVPINFNEYPEESDPGPYPVPSGAPVEGGGDHHVLVVEQGSCHLYELFHSAHSGSGWSAGSGATWSLGSDALRTDGWTSGDQAGLPILPGLVRYDEAVTQGAIHHALRFTINNPGYNWVAPARHPGSSSDAYAPPMGARLRLRADFDLTPYHGTALVILTALKRYGMYVADTGSNWFISGATDSRWNDTDLGQLMNVPGTAFEVVQLGTLEHW